MIRRYLEKPVTYTLRTNQQNANKVFVNNAFVADVVDGVATWNVGGYSKPVTIKLDTPWRVERKDPYEGVDRVLIQNLQDNSRRYENISGKKEIKFYYKEEGTIRYTYETGIAAPVYIADPVTESTLEVGQTSIEMNYGEYQFSYYEWFSKNKTQYQLAEKPYPSSEWHGYEQTGGTAGDPAGFLEIYYPGYSIGDAVKYNAVIDRVVSDIFFIFEVG